MQGLKIGGRRTGPRLAPLLVLVILALTTRARGEVTVGSWEPMFRGVEFARGSASDGDPRRQDVRAVRIDLRDPDIELFTTPDNGGKPLETTSETTSEFLLRHRLQVAVNANYFTPCCEPGDKELAGLAISRGQIVSRAVAAGTGSAVLALTRDKRGVVTTSDERFDPAAYWTAVAGSHIVLRGGERVEIPPTPFTTTPHPRTAAGLTADGRYLILLVIDGRQPDHSFGATMAEVADWLQRFGAHDGLNLDGGGSAALVREEAGRALVVNRPSGIALGSAGNSNKPAGERRERSNGNHLGVFAKPLSSVFLPRR